MYDAVVSIRGGFEPYALRTRPAGARGASVEAAVAAAAYTVLRHYFPSSAVNLDRDYAAGDGSDARTLARLRAADGVAVAHPDSAARTGRAEQRGVHARLPGSQG